MWYLHLRDFSESRSFLSAQRRKASYHKVFYKFLGNMGSKFSYEPYKGKKNKNCLVIFSLFFSYIHVRDLPPLMPKKTMKYRLYQASSPWADKKYIFFEKSMKALSTLPLKAGQMVGQIKVSSAQNMQGDLKLKVPFGRYKGQDISMMTADPEYAKTQLKSEAICDAFPEFVSALREALNSDTTRQPDRMPEVESVEPVEADPAQVNPDIPAAVPTTQGKPPKAVATDIRQTAKKQWGLESLLDELLGNVSSI